MIETAYRDWLESAVTMEYFENRGAWYHAERPDFACSIYRAFDSEGRLLYVGVSKNFWNRISDHRNCSPWYKAAQKIYIHECDDRSQALAMEQLSIWLEKPIFNVQGNIQCASMEYLNLDVEPACRNCNEPLDPSVALIKRFCNPCREVISLTARLCKRCDDVLNPEWCTAKQQYCTKKCKNAEWYERHKDYHVDLYESKKDQWQKSAIGKRAGVPIREWLKLSDDWR